MLLALTNVGPLKGANEGPRLMEENIFAVGDLNGFTHTLVLVLHKENVRRNLRV
jgi:hypothetical protein